MGLYKTYNKGPILLLYKELTKIKKTAKQEKKWEKGLNG